MNQQISDYLEQNKATYPKETLVQELRKTGYAESDIQEAVTAVFGSDNNNMPMPNVPVPQIHKEDQKTSFSKAILIVIVVLFVFTGIFFVMKLKDRNTSDNIKVLDSTKDSLVGDEKNTTKTQADNKSADNKKSICFANATDIDISEYDPNMISDAELAIIGVDYFNLSNFEKAAVCLEEALAGAVLNDEPKMYVDDIRMKLGVTYVNLGRIEEGRALFKEVEPSLGD